MSTSSVTSDLKSASGVICVGRNRLNAVSFLGDGVNAGTLTLYDNATTASGKVIAKVQTRTTDVQNHIIFTFPVYVENGIYAQMVGTGATYVVYYGA